MSRISARATQFPLRVRLVAGFSATMLLVLAAAGSFVYWRVAFALDRQVNEDLTELSHRLKPFVTPRGQLAADAPALAGSEAYQVLDRAGQVLAHSRSLTADSLITPAAAHKALRRPVRQDIGPLLPINNRPLRAYAIPLPRAGDQRAAVLVVAVRRDHRDEALLELLVQLSVAGIGALLVTAVVGERLARLALRPVERYRIQAVSIIAGDTGVRLDVPPNRDDEVTRLGHTLNATLDALQNALETERRFVNDASHELRTPLTLLKTRVQLALRRPRTATEHEAVLAEIETDLVRLTRLADQLLRIGAAEATNQNAERTDLADAAEQEASRRNALATGDGNGHANHPIAVHTFGPVYVDIGLTQVNQILGNLLDNAALHGQPPITITVNHTAGIARLLVVDAGDGMDAEMLANATRRFSRSDKARSRTGFGLGLSLVEATVNAADGELRLCHAGTHQTFGHPQPSPCDHSQAMTVTVLLPTSQPNRRLSLATAETGPAIFHARHQPSP
jgi:signal transduction histidine kinase